MQSLKITTPPRTILEVYNMLPEGTLAEIINGTLYMSPAPTTNHQRIIGKLFRDLSLFVEQRTLGEVFLSPCDVYLDEHSNVVQPDIIFVSESKAGMVQRNGIHGIPDVLIEILSPGNSSHDSKTKKDMYEEFGVKEYWIVNPETKEAVGYVLNNEVYVECGRFTGEIQSPLFDHTIRF
jgi:Uma2 family endonuclease